MIATSEVRSSVDKLASDVNGDSESPDSRSKLVFASRSELLAAKASEMSSSSGSKPRGDDLAGGTNGTEPMSTLLLVSGGSLLAKLLRPGVLYYSGRAWRRRAVYYGWQELAKEKSGGTTRP